MLLFSFPVAGLALVCLLGAFTRRWWSGPLVTAIILLWAYRMQWRYLGLFPVAVYSSLLVWPVALVMWVWGRDPNTRLLSDKARRIALITGGLALAWQVVSYFIKS